MQNVLPLLLNIPEEIETKRLILRMPKAGYGDQLCEAILDGYEDYVKWLNWPSMPPTPEAVEIDCRKHHAEFILRDFIRYLVLEKSTGQIIGRCAYPSFQVNWSIPQVGISYFIRKSKRGQGYGTEVAHALAVLAFKILCVKKIEIYCDVENKASWRVPEKLNFELEYTQRGGWPRPDSKLAELRTYSLFTLDNLPKGDVSF